MIKPFVLNFAGVCFLVWTWWVGTFSQVMESDASHMGIVIMSLFALGVLSFFYQVREAEKAKAYSPQGWKISLSGYAIKKVRINSKHIGLLSGALFILGVIGNAKGLSDAFKHLDVNALTTAAGAAKFGIQVVGGISSTFGATIFGCIFGLWTAMNDQVLDTKLSLLELEEEYNGS